MNTVFYISSAVAIISTVLAITRLNAVHALLYFIVSLLSVALVFFVLGAPFVAALEIIIYAGAIMVLFLFVVMTLNLGSQALKQEKQWLSPKIWLGPIILTTVLIAELVYLLTLYPNRLIEVIIIGPKQVGTALFGPYLLGVELASILLLTGLMGAYHIGRRGKAVEDSKRGMGEFSNETAEEESR